MTITTASETKATPAAPMRPHPGFATRPPLVLVTCSGRSGSKWMLRLLDFHPETLCRNEPERMTPALKDPATPDWGAWEELAMAVGARIGFVDRPPAMPKRFMRGWVARTRADRVLYAKRVQRLTGRHPEAGYPTMLYRPALIEQAQRVLKVINARHFMCRLLKETDHVPVVHMVRHPGGMLNSWLNRFAPTQDEEALIARQREILEDIHGRDPSYRDVTGPADGKDLIELKLWCWRHAQDAILEAGAAHRRYAAVVFERLSVQPIEVMEPIYAMCGLEYTDEMRGLIREETAGSAQIATAWKDRLPAASGELIGRVLEGSRVGRLNGIAEGPSDAAT